MSDPLSQAIQIGESFLNQFFSQGADFSNFYGNDSLLSFESEIYEGSNSIIQKLSSLPPLKHDVKNYNILPSTNGILIYLSGLVTIENENPINFVRVFFLAAANNSFYVKNDIYKFTFA